MLKLQAVLWK